MINEILSLWDEALHDKCWIDIYGRLAITGKQKIGEKVMKFPVSVDVITSDLCIDGAEQMKVLVPNDMKTGVAFWKTISPILYTKIPGLASHRRIKKAETTVQFVCWINIKKASGVNESSNWGSVINGIVKDAVKTIDCINPLTPTGVDGITNLKVEITGIGDIESWRKAMSEYSIEKLEAISVWPFSGFTITCKLSFLVRSDCFEAFTCNTEATCFDTFYVIDENENALSDASNLVTQ